ncbi:hypothetical protein A9Q83_13385 [Alphaproteobacteria bacterium 46_93_T64]|nr:hypothetical protein A9Q83_13385 [Alphaproteobacteria bacterium 46_93_T64]
MFTRFRAGIYISLLMSGFLSPALAYADTLDFTELNGIPSFSVTNLVLSNATITRTSGDNFFPFFDGNGPELSGFNNKGSICAISGGFCLGSMTITFDNDIQNLSVGFTGYNSGDEVIVSGWNDGILSNFMFVTNQSIVDFSFFGVIDELKFFNDSAAGNGDGLLYRDFNFDTVEVIATPLPAALPLFGAALLGLGLTGLRRKKKNS